MNIRQTTIIELLGENQRIDVRNLAERFSVSEMTIRRDLTDLEKQGLLVRTHGGAVSAGKLRFMQSAIPHYSVSPEKEAIGKLAASMVSSGQTIMIDTGTSALEVALNLPNDASITVATTSLCVAQALYGSPLNVLLLGGFLRKDFPSLYGPLTESLLESFHVDTLFMGCDGANSVEGLYTVDLHVATFEKAMMRIADKVILVAESKKFAKKAFVKFASLKEVHLLVTDSNISAEDRMNIEEQGVNVLIADDK